MGMALDRAGQVATADGMSRADLLTVGALGTLSVLGLMAGGQMARGVTALVSGASGGLAHFRRSTFSPHVGSGFSVKSNGSQPLGVKLTKAHTFTNWSQRPSRLTRKR